jgi:hypothetical protein
MLSTYDDNEAAIMQKARDKRKFLNVAEKNGAVRINIESRLALRQSLSSCRISLLVHDTTRLN